MRIPKAVSMWVAILAREGMSLSRANSEAISRAYEAGAISAKQADAMEKFFSKQPQKGA